MWTPTSVVPMGITLRSRSSCGTPRSVNRRSRASGRISKPGRRVYEGAGELPRVLGGLGVAIISTSQGVMTDKQARRSRVGGEVLAYVW